jgi:hypothetical protein
VLCEERVLAFKAMHPAAALKRAKKLGGSAEHDYQASGGHVFFEFLGVMELRGDWKAISEAADGQGAVIPRGAAS